MFFSIGFKTLGFSLVAHSEWKDAQHGGEQDCRLFICCSQEQLHELLRSGEVHEGRDELDSLLADLPVSSSEHMVRLMGDTAATVAAMIVDLKNKVAEITKLTKRSELGGFWEPTAKRPPGSGIIIWVDVEMQYHVAIVNSKDQARSVIRSLVDWMSKLRRDRLLNQISRWNSPATCEEPPLLIEGEVAELMYWASIFGKAQGALKQG